MLDIALLRAISLVAEIETIHDGTTNHASVLLILGDNRPRDDIFISRHTDLEQFSAGMQRNGGPIPIIGEEVDLEAVGISLEMDIRMAPWKGLCGEKRTQQVSYLLL